MRRPAPEGHAGPVGPWAIGGWTVAREGDRLCWRRGDETLRQAVEDLRSGPPVGVERTGAVRVPLEVLVRATFPADPAAPAAVYGWIRDATHTRADAAIRTLVGGLARADGPAALAEEVLEGIRGPGGTPVPDRIVASLEAAAAAEDPTDRWAPLVDAGLQRTWLRRSTGRLGRALGVLPHVGAALAGRVDADAARALWREVRHHGAEPGDAGVLDERAATADAEGDAGTAFWLSCAARHAAVATSAPLPPVRSARPGSVRLDGDDRTPTTTFTSSWTPFADPTPPAGRLPDPDPCRICASGDVETVGHHLEGGTGWRAETHDTRCRSCGAFTRASLQD